MDKGSGWPKKTGSDRIRTRNTSFNPLSANVVVNVDVLTTPAETADQLEKRAQPTFNRCSRKPRTPLNNICRHRFKSRLCYRFSLIHWVLRLLPLRRYLRTLGRPPPLRTCPSKVDFYLELIFVVEINCDGVKYFGIECSKFKSDHVILDMIRFELCGQKCYNREFIKYELANPPTAHTNF